MTDTTDEIETDESAEIEEPAPPPGVPITVNGEVFYAAPGRNLIDACEDAGVYVPRFCYHPRMTPVGMCRMCLIEVDTGRGPALTPSCMLTVSDGMVVETETEAVKKAQDGVLELLLINHPLDCPVCDKGGECPLQDQTMSYGPGESRFVEEKRHFEKPIPISDTVYLDRERCILCDRCTRFAAEVAGDPLIHFMGRGNQTEVNTFPDDPFSSYFSGNTVQICPVGALTAKPYRFKARPWDLSEVASTYPNAMGDRITIQSSRNEVLRYLGVDSDAVNWGWLTDRDRFSFEATMSEQRLTAPLMRGDGLGNVDDGGDELVATTWAVALQRLVTALEDADNNAGPESVAVLGGAQLTNEGQYAWARFAKGVIGTDSIDAQMGDGLPADIVASMPRTTISQACAKGGTIVLLSGDPKEELGSLYLRLRHAVVHDGATLIELTPNETGLTKHAAHSVRVRPGEVASVAAALVTGTGGDELAAASAAITGADSVSVICGRTSLADNASLTVDAINTFASLDTVRFLPALRRSNVHGAIDLGLTPGMLPGRTSLDAARAAFTAAWGSVPAKAGRDTAGILADAAAGKIAVLFLLGADPLADFPDPELAKAALDGAGLVISIDPFVNESAAYGADIVMPAAAFGEVDGSHTNLEGRITPLRQKVTPPGTARPDWMIAAELAMRLGKDMGFASVADITNEIAAVSPMHANADAAAIDAASDGVLVSGGPAWTDQGAPTPAPAYDRYSFRLVVDRTMYDGGTQTTMCPSIAELSKPGAVRISSTEASKLGVRDGAIVRISSQRASVEGPVVIDDRVASGIAAVAHNHVGLDIRSLIDMNELVTDVRIETV
ncbi:MAG: NADH-quinone oxidoreductase subunit NuoG [Acidimicrobiales bacterium]|jgi:NADH-quinone oxidoreductase subunit G